jgi:hypothetical protein
MCWFCKIFLRGEIILLTSTTALMFSVMRGGSSASSLCILNSTSSKSSSSSPEALLSWWSWMMVSMKGHHLLALAPHQAAPDSGRRTPSSHLSILHPTAHNDLKHEVPGLGKNAVLERPLPRGCSVFIPHSPSAARRAWCRISQLARHGRRRRYGAHACEPVSGGRTGSQLAAGVRHDASCEL